MSTVIGQPLPGADPQTRVEAPAHDDQTPYHDPAPWRRLAEAEESEGFAAAWLELQCRLIQGVIQGMVVLGAAGPDRLIPTARWPSDRENSPGLTAVAELALAERRGVVRQHRNSRNLEKGPPAFDLAYPLVLDGQPAAVVAVTVTGREQAGLRGVMRRLQWGMGWLEARLRRPDRNSRGANDQPAAVLDLLAACLEPTRFQAAATALVTELAVLLNCERVSLGIRPHRHSKIVALSHSAQFGHKSNLIRAIGAAQDEALDQQALLVWPAGGEGPARVDRAHGELARQYGSGALCTVPLTEKGRLCGALTLERPADQPFDADSLALCEAVAALAGPILETKRRDDRWLIVKGFDALTDALSALLGRGHLIAKIVTLGLIALVAFLATAQGQYRIAADTVLEGAIQRSVVAPVDGYVVEALVRAGDQVTAGQPLFRLDDRDLRLERLKWAGQEAQYQRQYRDALAEHDRAQVRILKAQLDQARAQLALLDAQLERVRAVAPFAGLVVSGDLSQSIGAPVSRGDVLFQVAPLDAYRVVLKVDERQVADVRPGQQGRLALAGHPQTPLPFLVERITPVASSEEGRNFFRVEASLEEVPDFLRPGLEGVGKIDVDRQRLIWIWSHELIDWLRLKAWSWWP